MNALLANTLRVTPGIFFVVALLLLLRIPILIISSCSNAPTVDELSILSVLSRLFEGTLSNSPLAILRMCDVASVNLLPTVLCDCLIAFFFHYDVRIQLLVGVSFHVLAATILGLALPRKYGDFWKVIYLSSMLILYSLTSLSTIFFNGQTCMSSGLVSCSFALAITALQRMSNFGLLFVLLSLSVLFLSLFGRFYFYVAAISIVAAVVLTKSPSFLVRLVFPALVPSALLSFILMKPPGNTSEISFSIERILGIIGLPLSNGFADTVAPCAESIVFGLSGITFLLCMIYIIRVLKISCETFTVPIALGCFGLTSVLAIGLFRSSIFAWYAGCALPCWVGLIGLAVHGYCELSVIGGSKINSLEPKLLLARRFFLFIYLSIMFVVLRSDWSYIDKDYFWRTHTPASEAAIRHFEYAPTISEQYISPGPYCGMTHPATPLLCKIAPILKHFRWSGCAREQTWLLQGYYLFPTVELQNEHWSRGVAWIEGTNTRRRRNWDRPEHLNLRLAKGSRLVWTVHIPAKIDSAKFVTSTFSKISTSCPKFSFEIQARRRTRLTKGQETKPNWQYFETDLTPYAGETIDLSLAHEGSESAANDELILRTPRICLSGVVENEVITGIVACNTSLSPLYPSRDREAFELSPCSSPDWNLFGLTPKNRALTDFKIRQQFAKLTFGKSLNIPVRDTEFICLDLQQNGVGIPICCVQLTINGARIVNMFLPIAKFNHWIEHSIDLKHYDLEPTDFITGITIFPTYHQGAGEVSVKQVRFVRYRRTCRACPAVLETGKVNK